MKKFVIGAFIWLIVSFGIQTVIVQTFNFSPAVEVGIFTIVMLIAAPIAITITKVLYPKTGKNIRIFFKNNVQSIQTGLPTSSGTIKGPKFDIPDGYAIQYRNAKTSPSILHYYREDGSYRGFIVDFGNGQVGMKDDTQSITNCSGNLQVKFKSPDGSSQSFGWKKSK